MMNLFLEMMIFLCVESADNGKTGCTDKTGAMDTFIRT